MKIEIFTREEYALNGEKALVKKLSHALPGLKKAAESKLYIIEGDYSFAEKKSIACEVLLDGIVERYSFKPRRFPGRYQRFEIWFKDGITDVAGESVTDAIADVGLKKPERVHTGKAIYIFTADGKKTEKAIREVLTNELIHKVVVAK